VDINVITTSSLRAVGYAACLPCGHGRSIANLLHSKLSDTFTQM